MSTPYPLARMANQMAANIAHEPDPPRFLAEHIRLFWSPDMRRDFADVEDSALCETARAARDLLGEAHGGKPPTPTPPLKGRG